MTKPAYPKEITRESLIAYKEQLVAYRRSIETTISTARRTAAAHGQYLHPKELAALENAVAALKKEEFDALDKARTMPKAYDRTIGRRYKFLCKALAEEFGESGLQSFILRAEDMARAEDIAKEITGEDW